MKKTALVLSLSVLTFIYGKHDPNIRPRVKNEHLIVSKQTPKITSPKENSLVQLQNAGMIQMQFIHLQKALGKIDIASYAIEGNTPIVLIETLNHNISVKGFNKMVDNFNSLYSTDNESLMGNYQNYADQNCQKIYGCVGSEFGSDCDWKIIKFLPNPENCKLNPTITMSNVMLYK
ncbi:MAG: hypothetical protein U5N85_07570 [Arcicella sp.]|nr:hypothetical protein [Arcicella sp.]